MIDRSARSSCSATELASVSAVPPRRDVAAPSEIAARSVIWSRRSGRLRREKVALARKRAEAEPEARRDPCRRVPEEPNLLAALEGARVVLDGYLDRPYPSRTSFAASSQSKSKRSETNSTPSMHSVRKTLYIVNGSRSLCAVRDVEEPREHPVRRVHDRGRRSRISSITRIGWPGTWRQPSVKSTSPRADRLEQLG